MKQILFILLFSITPLSWADFSAKQEEIIDRHLERIEEKLPLIMDTWNPPNNEPQCVSFEIYEVIEEIPTNQTEMIKLSEWNLREKHSDYCGGHPETAPSIARVDFYLINGEEVMRFEKWCHTDLGYGKEYMNIMVIVDDDFKGGCPEYIEGFNHETNEFNKK